MRPPFCIPASGRRCARRWSGARRWYRPPRRSAAYVRSHFDAVEARVADAPRAGEIVVAVAVTDGGRPLPRVGGLQVSEIQGKDGLR